MMPAFDEPTLTERISLYWSNAEFDQIPPSVIAITKRFVLDTVAVGIAAAGTDVVGNAVQAAVEMAGVSRSGASIWGRPERLPPDYAALVNGTACHVLELDDYGGCGHSGAVVIPAALALVCEQRVIGKDFLMAVLAGYDVASRVMAGVGGYRPHTRQGWHSTGTCGSFAAAAAAARIMRLETAHFASALGIAGSFTGGIWSFLVDGSMTKRLHCGMAARTGVSAAFLSRSGMTGPRYVLEAEWGGFYSTYGRADARPELTLEGLGQSFGIMDAGMKPYPCCRDMHHAIDGIIAILKETGRDHRAIAAIRVHGSEQTVRQFSKRDINTLLDAQFSFPYCLAVAALSGAAGLSQFIPLRTSEPEIGRLMDVVEIVADRPLAAGEYPSVEVLFEDGRKLAKDVRFAKGAPQNPLSDEELAEKAEELIAPVLGYARCRDVMNAVAVMEDLQHMSEFVQLLQPEIGR